MVHQTKRKLLLVIMDGVGTNPSTFGNAVANAHTPVLKLLRKKALHTTLMAHGTYVGLPSDQDIGNSEVGHNALGAGRVFDQGAKLVQLSIDRGQMFAGNIWKQSLSFCRTGTLHFMGLLSDGNVHSHENHLHAMIRKAREEGVRRIRLHLLFDGRDVAEKSAEVYWGRLKTLMAAVRSPDCDIEVASGGGRMVITMDRYEADWGMVAKGWKAHVHGEGPAVPSVDEALAKFRETELSDQYMPPFVVHRDGAPLGPIKDGDSVIFFNFRGDRAIEISRAFTETSFTLFDRGRFPKTYYAGMMQYDGDTKIPSHFLVDPPAIDHTLGEYMVSLGVRQFACSETQKFGHVTYFWNGNRSGYIDPNLEEYYEITSDQGITFDLKPWMKAAEICDITIERLKQQSFDFGRINFPNGDMVGHTGNYDAALVAVEVVDLMLGRLLKACQETGTILVVTADHGNAEEMFDAKEFAGWQDLEPSQRPRPKTSHTLFPVPLFVFDPLKQSERWNPAVPTPSLAHLANTILELMGLPTNDLYLPSLG